MKRNLKILFTLVFLILGFIYINFFSSYVFPWQEKNAIQTTLTWGGLAQLPNGAKIINVEKNGSLFTRTFIVFFRADKEEIDKWIEKSKRLRNNKPKLKGQLKTYEIYPGVNKSFGGKVSVNNGSVTIKMSWS